MIASELGLDANLAKGRGSARHRKAMTHEVDGSHVAIGVELAKNTGNTKKSSTPSNPITATLSLRHI